MRKNDEYSMRGLLFVGLLMFSLLFVAMSERSFAEDGSTVNIYSYRKAYLLEPLLERFTEKTGIKTKVVYAKEGLISRLLTEGNNSPADLLIAPSYNTLNQAVEKKVSQELPSSVIASDVAKWFVGKDRQWLALSVRSRVIFASKDRVPANTVQSYTDLANPKFKGRVCIRSGIHPYNLSLFGEYLSIYGEKKAKEFLIGLKNNLARKPQGNDRDQLRAISNGTCDLALVNSYYYMIMRDGDEKQRKVVSLIYPIVPSQGEVETHINVSGVVLSKWSKNRQNALKLVEFMLSAEGQKLFVEQNKEWPVSLKSSKDLDDFLFSKAIYYTKNNPPNWDKMYRANTKVLKILKEIDFNQ